MQRNFYLAVAALGLVGLTGLVLTLGAQTASSEKHAFTPDAIPYGPPPPFLAPGAQLAPRAGHGARLDGAALDGEPGGAGPAALAAAGGAAGGRGRGGIAQAAGWEVVSGAPC